MTQHQITTKRSTALLKASVLALATLAFSNVYAENVQRQFGQSITVYKTPSCGCCHNWVNYLKDNGFRVETHDLANLDGIKAEHGLTDPQLKSCHTALVDGYVVEGHVPADDIWRLLNERPNVIGISAPGMPQMSPGMASIEPKGYDVLSFDKENKIKLFSRY